MHRAAAFLRLIIAGYTLEPFLGEDSVHEVRWLAHSPFGAITELTEICCVENKGLLRHGVASRLTVFDPMLGGGEKMSSPAITRNPARTANPATNPSTGPRTPEGKARSSQNARKHGFSALTLQVLPSEQAEFDIYQNELLDQIKPAPGLQADLFRQLTHTGWSLVRLERYELEILAQGNPFDSTESQNKLDRLERYRAGHRRAYSRILNEIRKLQTDAMLWSTTHKVVTGERDREFPIANPAGGNLNKRIADLADECKYQDAIRLVKPGQSGAGSFFDKTNSPAGPSPVFKPASSTPEAA